MSVVLSIKERYLSVKKLYHTHEILGFILMSVDKMDKHLEGQRVKMAL